MEQLASITKPVFQQLNDEGINLRNYDEGQQKTICPQCSPDRKNSRDPCLSVNIDGKGARWRCHHCQWDGNVWSESLKRPPTIRKATPKKPPIIPNTKSIKGTWGEKFFEERGLSLNIAEEHGVGIASHFVDNKRQDCIAFVYKNADGVPTNIKFRTADKKYAQLPDCERFPYLLDCLNVEESEILLICEGEMDAITWKICPDITKNVISIPDGASDRKMDWLTSFDIGKYKKIYLALDADDAGIQCREEIARRVGRERCFIIAYPDGYKDANEVWMNSKDALVQCYEIAEPYPIKSLYTANPFMEEGLQLFRGGLRKGLSTGIDGMDEIFLVRPQEVTICSGVPNCGKSEFIDAIAVNMAKDHDYKFAICSFENPVSEHLNKLAEKKVGKPARKDTWVKQMEEEELLDAYDWLAQHFFFVRAEDESPTIDWCIQALISSVLRYGVNAVILDPYNEFDHKRPTGMTETEYVSQMMSKLRRFAQNFGVHVFFVAHPAKMRRSHDGTFPMVEPYDIAGSANFANKADVILIVERDFTQGSKEVRIHTKKMRFKQSGQIGSVDLEYDYISGRYGKSWGYPSTEDADGWLPD
jgi:twinkle protein